MSESLERFLQEQSRRWTQGQPLPVEAYVAQDPTLQDDPEKLLDLIYHEVLLREQQGEMPRLAEYQQRFPTLTAQLQIHFAFHEALADDTIPKKRPDPDFLDSMAKTNPTCRGGLEGETPAEPGNPLALGRYQPLRFHARGGLGEVLIAQDQELQREVALKQLQVRHAHDPDSRRRFLQEAEITSRLEHPGIVPVYGLLREKNQLPGYAMRFIQGESLNTAIQRLHEMPAAQGAGEPARHTLRQLVSRFLAVCNTIAYAHSRGVLHRDLKPANIMLGPYGETLVIDWGLAKLQGRASREGEAPAEPLASPDADAGSSEAETQAGEVLGTPAYMSPEQAAGRWQDVGPASDIYSLGATLYHLLTGQAPFPGTDFRQTLEQVKQGAFPAPQKLNKEVPRPLEAICLKAMARQPQDRYASALDLAADLDRWLADEAVTAWREPWSVRARRWLSRRRTLVTGVAAALLATLVILSVATLLLNAAYQREHKRLEQSAAAQLNLALLEGAKASPAEAIATYEKVLPLYQQIARQEPDYLDKVSTCYNNLGSLYKEIGDLDQAERAYGQAIDFRKQLIRHDPEMRRYQLALAISMDNLGQLQASRGNREQAEEVLQQAVVVLEGLVRDPPTTDPDSASDYPSLLAQTCSSRGSNFYRQNKFREAQESFTRASALLEELSRANPGNADYRLRLARLCTDLEQVHKSSGDLKQAQQANARGRALWDRLALDRLALGQASAGRRNWEQAKADFEEAIDLLEELVRTRPAVVEFQVGLANAWHQLGAVYRETHKFNLAEMAIRKEIAVLDQLVQDHPAEPSLTAKRAAAYLGLADFLRDRGHPAKALAGYAQWIQVGGDHAGGIAATKKLRERIPPFDMILYYSACAHAVAAAVVHQDGQLTSQQRTELAQQYAEEALVLLRTLQAKGFFKTAGNRARLHQEPNLAALRNRADFQKLLAEAEGK